MIITLTQNATPTTPAVYTVIDGKWEYTVSGNQSAEHFRAILQAEEPKKAD